MIKTVIFDVDGTLYDFEAANCVATDILAQYAVSVFGVNASSFKTDFRRCLELQFEKHSSTAGCHSRAIRSQMYLESHGFSLRHAAQMNDLFWNTFLGLIKPFDGIQQLLLKLRARGLKLGVCTNMTADWQLKKLERLDIADMFDFMVSSEEAESEKPDLGIFNLCLEKAKCSADEAAFVGDDLVRDVGGASAAGLHPIWYAPDANKRAAHPDVLAVSTPFELAQMLAV